jgi:hypothetical protein
MMLDRNAAEAIKLSLPMIALNASEFRIYRKK